MPFDKQPERYLFSILNEENGFVSDIFVNLESWGYGGSIVVRTNDPRVTLFEDTTGGNVFVVSIFRRTRFLLVLTDAMMLDANHMLPTSNSF